ncbi:MAG: DUF996 domain-containing protein [Candidatus Bathyarchaeia archaeon]|jgi:uncharacterized membrane protein
MSLEPGRKLGLTASIINIVVPVIMVVLYGFFILSIIASIFVAFAGRESSSAFGYPFLSSGVISIAFIGLGLLGLVGFIFFVVAMYQLSHYYNEPGIFRNMLYGIVVAIVGSGSFTIVLIAIIISAINRAKTAPTFAPAVGLVIVGLLALICAFLAILIISAFFWRRAFNKLGEKSGNGNFNTAGLLILIGAALSIVGIGGLISWVAWIFAAMGFNSLKPKATETSAFPYATPQTQFPNLPQKRFCPYCGIENTPDSFYCVICGKKLQESQ